MRKLYDTIAVLVTFAIFGFAFNYTKDIVKDGKTAAFLSTILTILSLALCYWLWVGFSFLGSYVGEVVKFMFNKK